jgi:hypothetical protein
MLVIGGRMWVIMAASTMGVDMAAQDIMAGSGMVAASGIIRL